MSFSSSWAKQYLIQDPRSAWPMSRSGSEEFSEALLEIDVCT
jgi:hypothetical protein